MTQVQKTKYVLGSPVITIWVILFGNTDVPDFTLMNPKLSWKKQRARFPNFLLWILSNAALVRDASEKICSVNPTLTFSSSFNVYFFFKDSSRFTEKVASRWPPMTLPFPNYRALALSQLLGSWFHFICFITICNPFWGPMLQRFLFEDIKVHPYDLLEHSVTRVKKKKKNTLASTT